MSDVRDKINYLKKLYKEIVLGFSAFEHAGKPVFIKHFTELDNGEQETERIKWTNLGREKGLVEKEEKINFLIKEGYWTREKEIEIEKLQKEISDTELLLKNFVIKRQINSAKEKIRKSKEQLNQIENEKLEICGLCLEDFVNKKINELTIFNTFYKNKDLTEKLFSEEEFDCLPENQLGDLISLLNNFYVSFGHEQIKRISVCPFFVSIFSLANDDAFKFYGKRITDLTILQINLFSQAKYFKALIQSRAEQVTPPSDVLEDPDKMIEWYESTSTGQAGKSDGVSYVGATAEELQQMAGGGAINISDFAKKKGNKMTTKDFIEMHGI